MLAKISKSFRGSLGNLISDPDETSIPLGSMGEYCGSVVSESTGNIGGRRTVKERRKRFSQMFSSDAEEDAKSDVLAKPNFNTGEEQLMFLKRGLTAWRQR